MCRHQELTELGERLAAEGPHRHERELEELALAVGALSPGAAAVLMDRSAPAVLRERAFGVAVGVVLRTEQLPEEWPDENPGLDRTGEELQQLLRDWQGQLVGWGS